MVENAGVFDFELDSDDMEKVCFGTTCFGTLFLLSVLNVFSASLLCVCVCVRVCVCACVAFLHIECKCVLLSLPIHRVVNTTVPCDLGCVLQLSDMTTPENIAEFKQLYVKCVVRDTPIQVPTPACTHARTPLRMFISCCRRLCTGCPFSQQGQQSLGYTAPETNTHGFCTWCAAQPMIATGIKRGCQGQNHA